MNKKVNKTETNTNSQTELTQGAKELIKTVTETNESKEVQTVSKSITTSKSIENKTIRERKFKDIITLIETKGESLTKATKKIGLDKKSFLLMVEKDSTLLHHYTRATESRADLIAERMIRNSHNRANDFYTDSEGNLKPNPVAVQRDRLILDTDKWLLSKLAPKKYGDRLTLDGEVKTGAPLTIENINMILNELKE